MEVREGSVGALIFPRPTLLDGRSRALPSDRYTIDHVRFMSPTIVEQSRRLGRVDEAGISGLMNKVSCFFAMFTDHCAAICCGNFQHQHQETVLSDSSI